MNKTTSYSLNCLIRIMDKKYSESFLDGNIWINPISTYTKLEENPDDSCNNCFRGDYKENSCSNIRELDGSIFSNFSELEDDFIEQVNLDCSLSSINTLCFYLFKYDSSSRIILPDMRMSEFGDKVIVITEPEAFLNRVTNKISKLYPDSFCMLHEISYYDENVTHENINPVFFKREKYSYQNELRFAISKYGNPLDFQVRNKNNEDKNTTICICIGDIRDFAYSISIDQFLSFSGNSLCKRNKSKQEIDNIVRKLSDNALLFINGYKPSSMPVPMVLLYPEFLNSEFKDEGLQYLQKAFVNEYEDSPRKDYKLD